VRERGRRKDSSFGSIDARMAVQKYLQLTFKAKICIIMYTMTYRMVSSHAGRRFNEEGDLQETVPF
jgi:hypothetical protein